MTLAYGFWSLLYIVPAIISGTLLVSRVWPRRVTQRWVPLLMLGVGLVVLALPVALAVILAAMLPAAWLAGVMGLTFANDGADYSPAVKATGRAGRKIAALSGALANGVRQLAHSEEPTPVTQYLTRAYPAPGEAEEPTDGADSHADELGGQDKTPDPASEPQTLSAARTAAQEARERVARLTSSPASSSVRKFVPDLI